VGAESETASYERTCRECGVSYAVGSRDQGGPFHFMIVSLSSQPDTRMRIIGHWRSGDWKVGQTLYLRRRDGHQVPIIGAEMLPELNQVCEDRGQRALLIPNDKHLQPHGCIWATRTGPPGD
jgi:hypothetical protein